MLVQHRRLRLKLLLDDWIEAALGRPKIELLAFTPKAAVRAAGFGAGFPGDPADRFIAAAALEASAPLVTADQAITAWGGVEVIW